MNRKTFIVTATALVIAASFFAAIIFTLNAGQDLQQEFAFTVNGTNDCLRFLDREVQTLYVPIRTGTDERWKLTITCSKMPGSSSGAWTDLYVYGGYWDQGKEHKCISEQLYPIMDEIRSTGFRIQTNSTYSEVFGGSNSQSYTFFIIFPTGGPSTFDVRLENVNEKPLEIVPIRIQSDGSIDPSNVPIQRNGDLYTFTGDICGTIVVDRDNITIDGAGHILRGTYNGTRTDSWVVGQGPDQELSNETLWTMGIDFDVVNKPNNLTVRNLNIKNFYIGIYVWTSNNTITDSSVTDNIVGVLLSGDYNNITDNYIARNDQGVFFGVNTPGKQPLKVILSGNSIVNNDVQFSGCYCEEYNTEELVHTWDNGKKGNYWSDYNGTDSDRDGIGDTPYVIDLLNEDRYPLIQMLTVPPAPTAAPTSVFESIVVIVGLAAIASIAVFAIVVKGKTHRQKTKKIFADEKQI